VTALTVAAVFGLASCAPEEEDPSISEITIYNIPAQIPVIFENTVKYDTYKIYLNASDYMEEYKPPKAQGFLILTPEMKQADGTYTAVIKLKKAKVNLKIIDAQGTQNPDYNPNLDVNEDDGPWSGTAKFFSLLITPANKTEHAEKAIWIRGGGPLDKGMRSHNWGGNKPFLNDFNWHIEGNTSVAQSMRFSDKAKALYDDIVCKDKNIGPLGP
jgi:hypothetical protein